MTAGGESATWLLLSAEYHRVLARSPSPGAAEIAISEARQNGRLRMRAVRDEYKAQPGRFTLGEQPPQLPPIVTPDCPIYATDNFDHWDWDRNEASRRDSETKSLFWYRQIEVNRDDAQMLWPEKAPVEATVAVVEPAWPGLKAEKPKDVAPKVWVAMRALATLETEGMNPESIPQP